MPFNIPSTAYNIDITGARNNMRKHSKVIVKVLDLDSLKEQAFHALETKALVEDHDVIGLLDNGPFAIYENENGTFILDHTGLAIDLNLGTPLPRINFYLAFKNGGFIDRPSMALDLTADFIKNIPIKEEVPLDEFIIKGSPPNEENFIFLDDYLKPSFKCPLIRDRDHLKRYGTFLINKLCHCGETQKPLIEVSAKICCNMQSHVHCALCGGIF